MELPQAKSNLKTALRLWYEAYREPRDPASVVASERLFDAYRALLLASNKQRWNRQIKNQLAKMKTL